MLKISQEEWQTIRSVCASWITAHMLGYFQRNKLQIFKQKVIYIQTFLRKLKARIIKKHKFIKIIWIQSLHRMHCVHKRISILKENAIHIQKEYRKHLSLQHIKRVKNSVYTLYPNFKRFLARLRIYERTSIRNYVYSLIKRTYDSMINAAQIRSVTFINSFMRLFLFRINNPTLMKKIYTLKFRRTWIANAIYIQSFYRMHLGFLDFHSLKWWTDIIRGFWKMKKLSKIINTMRKNSVRIQVNFRKYLKIKSVYEEGMKTYMDKKYNKEAANEIKDIQEYFCNYPSKKLKHFFPAYKPFTVFDEKLYLFSKVLDYDFLNPTKVIYEDNYWIRSYEVIEQYLNKELNSPWYISTGEFHTVILTNKGKAVSFGWDNNSQLLNTLNSTSNNISTVAVDENNSYQWNERRCLWINNKNINITHTFSSITGDNCDSCYAITSTSQTVYWIKNCSSISKIRFPWKKTKIVKISAGSDFVFFLSENGIWFSYGKNSKGELGQNDFKERREPTPLSVFIENGDKIVSVKCGFKHVVCLSSSGKVYSFGSNSHGQLCLDKYGNFPQPMWIAFENKYFKGRNKILSIACGYRSSYFMNENRIIVFCGCSGVNLGQSYNIKVLNLYQILNTDSGNIHPIKWNCSWNKMWSVFYVTWCDIRYLYSMNSEKRQCFPPQKLAWMLNNLNNKWDENTVELREYIKGVSEYMYSIPK